MRRGRTPGGAVYTSPLDMVLPYCLAMILSHKIFFFAQASRKVFADDFEDGKMMEMLTA